MRYSFFSINQKTVAGRLQLKKTKQKKLFDFNSLIFKVIQQTPIIQHMNSNI